MARGRYAGSDAQPDPLANLTGDDRIVMEAMMRFRRCVSWESTTRERQDSDEKFAEGDSYNGYQWPYDLYSDRQSQDRPTLTINKVREHNLQIINDAKQNKPGVNIRPTGGGATYRAAQTYQAIVRHIEYESAAEQAYDWAFEKMVKRGIGYWRVLTDWENDKSFQQKLLVKRIQNPNAVYLDPDIRDIDGLDAEFGFIFEDMTKDRYRRLHPRFADVANQAPLGNTSNRYIWLMHDHVRVAEYYRKQFREDELILLMDEHDQESPVLKSRVPPDMLKQALGMMERRSQRIRRRPVQMPKVEWYKIAGETIIDRTISPGRYIPIIRCVAEETIIDGLLDRKGHTRALLDPQRIYNYNSSAAVEYGALQTKTPWVAAAESIAGYETYYENANIENRALLPYKAIGPEGVTYPAPVRTPPPTPSELYLRGMETARMEMMMASGQYEANFGQKSNERSGVAINARQRQGDNATYHYIDAQAIAIRATGKVLLDQIPLVYDTERIIRIKSDEGNERDIKIDPEAIDPYEEKEENGAEAATIIFNPSIGQYAVISDPGPSYATRRQEAFNALLQIIQADPKLMAVFGDLFFRSADFPLADEMADRFQRTIPPNILGKGPPPEVEQMQQQLMAMQNVMRQLLDEGARRDIDMKRIQSDKGIDEYDAETRRMSALKELLPVDMDGMKALVAQLVREALGQTLGMGLNMGGGAIMPSQEGANGGTPQQ